MRGKKEHGEERYIDNREKKVGICPIQLFAARGVFFEWCVLRVKEKGGFVPISG
jgi:hypothetical protein